MEPGNHTFAAIRGEESYDVLSSGLQAPFDVTNALIRHPTITIDDQTYSLEVFIGSDYKVCNHVT